MKRLFVGLLILSVVEGVGLVSPPVYAAVGNVIIDQSVTGSITAQNVTGVKFIDSANSSYFLDPAATGNALTTAGAVGIGTTSPNKELTLYGSTPQLNLQTTQNTIQGYVGITSQTAQFAINRDIGGNFSNTAAASAVINLIAGSNDGKITMYTSPTNNTLPVERVRIDKDGNVGIGTTAPGAPLQIGTAGTSTGSIRLTGSTSGYVEISSRAIGGSWSLNLPQGVGTAGYQLTDAAGNGNTSWAAAGSVRSMKNITGLFGDPNDALATIVGTNVYRFHYKPEMGTGDSTTEYVGVMADEAPWAVHYNGTVVNPVNTLGYMVLGIQALDKKITTQDSKIGTIDATTKLVKDQQYQINQLKADNEALKHKVSDYDELKARLNRLEIMVNAEPQE